MKYTISYSNATKKKNPDDFVNPSLLAISFYTIDNIYKC